MNFQLERVMGIEPTLPAWEAGVLPLNYTRGGFYHYYLLLIGIVLSVNR
jgi:hypothetical protein